MEMYENITFPLCLKCFHIYFHIYPTLVQTIYIWNVCNGMLTIKYIFFILCNNNNHSRRSCCYYIKYIFFYVFSMFKCAFTVWLSSPLLLWFISSTKTFTIANIIYCKLLQFNCKLLYKVNYHQQLTNKNSLM